MSHWQITVPVCGQAVLRLRPMGDAAGSPGAPKLVGRCPCDGPSYGMTPPGGGSCSQGKTAAGTKLSSVGSIVLGSARVMPVATSVSSISFEISACNAPTSRIALIEAQDIHLCNNLMHVFVHHILLGGEMGKLLLCTLAGIGHS